MSIQSTGNATANSNSGGTVNATGIASGLDVNAIITKLMAAHSQPLTTLRNQQASYQTRVSAFGTLSAALSSFQQSLSSLSSASTFNALSAASSNASIATATVSSAANPGSYNVNVSQLAQAQTISSAGQISDTSAIGSGSSTKITFQFGTITGTAVNGNYKDASFAPDVNQPTGSITIDSSNNSLQGIAAAINAANIGVQASIVGDGSATPHHLVLNSRTTGETSSLKIKVDGDASLQNLLSHDPAGAQNLKQVTAAQNTNLTVNGIAVTSSTNAISSSVKGLTFTAVGVGSTNINVASNTAAVTTAINSFITSYNSLNDSIAQLTSYNKTTKLAGPLLGNPTIMTLQNQIRSIVNGSTAGSGPDGGATLNLSQIGVTTQNNGTLVVSSSKLQTALTTDFKAVGATFAAMGSTTDSLTSYISSTTTTQAGTYAVKVTSLATQGSIVGDVNLTGKSTVVAANTSIKVSIDGISATVNIPEGSYTETQFAATLQSAINSNSAFAKNGVAVTASINTNGYLNVSSNSYGKLSNVTLNDQAGTTLSTFLGTIKSGTSGRDVAGTIDGLAAIGNGQFLTGATNSKVDGLQIQINGGNVGDRGTISFSKGYAYLLNNLISGHLGSNGIITNTTKGLNTQITSIQNQAADLQSHLNGVQKNYQAQFSALDAILTKMKGKQDFLSAQLSVLNGTRNK